MPNIFTRRRLIAGGLGIGGAALLSACTPAAGQPASPFAVPPTPTFGAPGLEATLRAGVTEVDLGGITATTWAYDGRIPGRELRAKAGDVLKIRVQNALPVKTSVHWHGIRLHNAADGVRASLRTRSQPAPPSPTSSSPPIRAPTSFIPTAGCRSIAACTRR